MIRAFCKKLCYKQKAVKSYKLSKTWWSPFLLKIREADSNRFYL